MVLKGQRNADMLCTVVFVIDHNKPKAFYESAYIFTKNEVSKTYKKKSQKRLALRTKFSEI
jgi:hypothetical protein